MTTQRSTATEQDWRTSDPVWADDFNAVSPASPIQTALFAGSISVMALVITMVAVLA